jgi:hypothetical protein
VRCLIFAVLKSDWYDASGLAGSRDTATPSPLTTQDEPATSDDLPVSPLQAVALLDTIPEINQRLAAVVVADIGTDMARFPRSASGGVGRSCFRQPRQCGQATIRTHTHG